MVTATRDLLGPVVRAAHVTVVCVNIGESLQRANLDVSCEIQTCLVPTSDRVNCGSPQAGSGRGDQVTVLKHKQRKSRLSCSVLHEVSFKTT